MGKVLRVVAPTNGAEEAISHGQPFLVTVTVEGAADLLFHRWNAEAIDEGSNLPKGSRGKKTDVIENYVYRNDKGELCIPGSYFRGAIINAAKFRQDPRSPRKSAMDLFKAGLVVTTGLASLGTKEWDYLDRRRVTIQRNGINRTGDVTLGGPND